MLYGFAASTRTASPPATPAARDQPATRVRFPMAAVFSPAVPPNLGRPPRRPGSDSLIAGHSLQFPASCDRRRRPAACTARLLSLPPASKTRRSLFLAAASRRSSPGPLSRIRPPPCPIWSERPLRRLALLLGLLALAAAAATRAMAQPACEPSNLALYTACGGLRTGGAHLAAACQGA